MEEKPKFDARLAEGVAYFEQMLQIMPEDRTTLEFLVVAYDQLDQHEKGQKALVELVKILIKERDIQALEGLLPRLEVSDYEPAKALFLKVKMLTAPAPDLTPEAPKELSEEEKTGAAMISAVKSQFSLINVLLEGGAITESEATNLRDHVGATPSDGRMFLVSALQILEKENSGTSEKCVSYLADKFSTPPIPLASFDPSKDLVSKLPKRLVAIRGVVPFATLGKLTLVATLDPSDTALRDECEAALGSCRFYLADPAAVESVIERVFGRGVV